ncbi:MAG: hypothetical protein HKO65_14870 [Gemmatimonadetes bacterium]|nr:hypothetical protein [Gemmatimonadota bacterium]NNM06372.1 hypothetical protein [Gemmatimonadota bacterium]
MKAPSPVGTSRLLIVLLLALGISPTAAVGQEVGPVVRGAFFKMIAEHFEVPVEEVTILGDWELSADEVPVVLFLSRRAGVSADALVGLRRGGRPWREVASRFGLSARVFHIPLPLGTPLGVLDRAYEQFRSRPAGEWDQIRLDDLELISLVNVRVLSEAVGVPPLRVLQSRDEAGTFAAGFASLIGFAGR